MKAQRIAARSFLFLLFQFTTVFCWGSVGGGVGGIDPVLASEQPVLTMKSMQAEVQQFRALGKWRSMQARLKSHEAQRDQFKMEWERAKSVTGPGAVSPSQLQMMEMNFISSENQVSRTKAEVQRERLQAFVAKYEVLSEGNPQADYRVLVAEETLTSLKVERQSLESSRKSAEANQSYYRMRYENGLKLYRDGVITMSEVEQRHLNFQTAEDQVRQYAHEVAAADEAIQGLDKTRQRLGPQLR